MQKPPLLAVLPPFSRILFSILLIISCFAITFLLATLLAVPLFQLSAADLLKTYDNLSDPVSIHVLKYFQIWQSAGLFILPALLAGWLFQRDPMGFLWIRPAYDRNLYFLTILLMVASVPFINGLVAWNESMDLPDFLGRLEEWMQDSETQASRLTEAFMRMPDTGTFILNLFMIAVLPAIGEELLFRGLFQRLLSDWLGNTHIAILIAAVLFSAMHLQFYGFIPRLVLGLMLGYLYFLGGSILLPILAHFIQNGSVVVVTWMGEQGYIGGDYENFGTTDNLWIIMGSFTITASLFLAATVIRRKRIHRTD